MNSSRIDVSTLLRGLLQYNFFPAQKKDEGEIPPIINSSLLTPEIADNLRNLNSRREGYDQVEYKSTRYNNVSRILSIPHPVPYSKLCFAIHDNWTNIEYITHSSNNLIKLEAHNDGRILVMDYENAIEKIDRHTDLTFNKKFYVKTDITNFFPSIYSHSIPWALVGFNHAKNHRDQNLWFNKIDKYVRLMKRNETNGIPIGPVTSNVISESILVKIDSNLLSQGFNFVRFIDDYTGYFSTYERAEEFILKLEEELSTYKLFLNVKKTNIEQLPCPSSPEWIVDLSTRIPNNEATHPSNLIRFLDYALDKQKNSPDGSVIKYATKIIIKDIKNENVETLIRYLLSICMKYPILIPLLDKFFDKIDHSSGFRYKEQLLQILEEHTKNHRSDAMTWIIYYLYKYNQEIPEDIANQIINSSDCLAILLLYKTNQHKSKIIDFCNGLDSSDNYQLDQYWILLYQLFLDDEICNPYSTQNDIDAFSILKNNGISFVSDI